MIKQDFDNRDTQYIITDGKGNIANVSQGLFHDYGLNSKFFSNNQGSETSLYSINMAMIAPELYENEQLELAEGDGTIVTIDTTDILNFVELELLNADEVLEVRSNLGVYQAYVQLRKYWYGGTGTENEIHVYRLVLLNEDDVQLSNNMMRGLITKTQAQMPSKIGQGSTLEVNHGIDGLDISHSGGEVERMDMSSTSSTQGMLTSTNTFYRIIRDFKKVLGERKTPKNLIYLNWTLIVIFSLSIVLSSIEYSLKQSLFEDILGEFKHNFYSQIRTIKLIFIASNLRSMVNVANNQEPNAYEGEGLVKVDRFSYLNRLIQTQADSLQQI